MIDDIPIGELFDQADARLVRKYKNVLMRTRYILGKIGIETIGQLIRYPPDAFLACKNFGLKSLEFLCALLESRGLQFNEPTDIDVCPHCGQITRRTRP